MRSDFLRENPGHVENSQLTPPGLVSAWRSFNFPTEKLDQMESSQLNSKSAGRSNARHPTDHQQGYHPPHQHHHSPLPPRIPTLLPPLKPAYLAKAHEDTTANSTPVPLITDPLRSVLALQPGRPARLNPGGRSLLRLIFPHQLGPY
jgi:hypothetical protein